MKLLSSSVARVNKEHPMHDLGHAFNYHTTFETGRVRSEFMQLFDAAVTQGHTHTLFFLIIYSTC